MKKTLMAALVLSILAVHGASAAPEEIAWRGWSDEAFAAALDGHRLVLLDLGAGWCHWCHVMDERTYGDPRVVALVAKHFVAVRVDQDSRPDLSNRYEDYGWPAFTADELRGRVGRLSSAAGSP